jgi:hypothetical protein
MVKYPTDLSRRKVRVQQQTGSGIDIGFVPGGFQRLTSRIGSSILPNDGRINRLTSGSIPDDRGFSLIGNANRSDIRCLKLCLGQGFGNHRQYRSPNFFGVVFNPPVRRKILLKFLLSDADNAAFLIKNHRSRAGGALID